MTLLQKQIRYGPKTILNQTIYITYKLRNNKNNKKTIVC